MNDPKRVSAVRSYDLLDTPPEDNFTNIALWAADRLGASDGGITIVDADRTWFKASLTAQGRSAPHGSGFCDLVVGQGAPLLILDAQADERYAERPFVASGAVRFYAGVPLVDEDGYVLGALCIWDAAPRTSGKGVISFLARVSTQVVALLTLRRRTADVERDRYISHVTNEVLEMVAKDAPLKDVLARIASAVDSSYNDTVSSVSLRDGDVLRLAAAPSYPAEYFSLVAATPVPLGRGVSGIAAATGEIAVMDDLQTGASTEHLQGIAAKTGYTSGFSAPIISADGDVLGTLTVCSTHRDNLALLRQSELERWLNLTSLAVSRSRAQERLRYMASHDAMTDLPTRFTVLDAAEKVVSRRNRELDAAVLILSLDRFKLLNDSYGHHVGDLYLRRIAERLTSSVDGDGMVGRLGGDSFVIFCAALSGLDSAERLAERLVAVAARSVEVEGHEVTLSASVGLAFARRSERSSATDLLRYADSAVYRAKSQGRNRYAVSEGLKGERSFERLALENELRQALASDELYCVYQPKVDLGSGRVAGLETLVRWNSPTRGEVSPAEFIPVAEDSGLIKQVGEQVLRSACAQMASWRETDPAWEKVVVWVNVSGHQLDAELPELVSAVLAETGLPGNRLGVEITESTLMADFAAARTAVEALRSLGVRIAIDDFGTGFSSLSQIKHFPVDVLKIDQSFVKGLSTDPADRSIVAAVVALAKALRLKVVAEGVETLEQRDELISMGCDMAQGYLYSRPQVAGEVSFVKLSSLHAPVQQ